MYTLHSDVLRFPLKARFPAIGNATQRNTTQAFSVAAKKLRNNATQRKSKFPCARTRHGVIITTTSLLFGSSDWLSSLRRTEKIELVFICLQTLAERRNGTCVALRYLLVEIGHNAALYSSYNVVCGGLPLSVGHRT